MNENSINEKGTDSNVLKVSNEQESSLYKPPVLSDPDEREISLVQRIKKEHSEREKTLCRQTVSICSKIFKRSSERMCLILQSIVFMLFTAGTTYAFYLLYLASDWFFAVGDIASRVVTTILFFAIVFVIVILGVMLWFGMLYSARLLKSGQKIHVYDIFFAFERNRLKKYLKTALLLALLFTVIGVCFGMLFYAVQILSVLVLGYYGEIGRISVMVASLPAIAVLTTISMYLFTKIFCVFELMFRCTDDRIFDIFTASMLLSRGREKEIGGLLLRWLFCALISFLSVGVLIPIFLIPGICTAYAASTDILIGDNGEEK